MNRIKLENQMIFVDEQYGFPRYQTGFNGKDKQGNFHNLYLDIKMPKDMPLLPNRSKINCDAFLSVEVWNDKNTGDKKKKLVLVARNVTLADGNAPAATSEAPEEYESFEAVQESIPF